MRVALGLAVVLLQLFAPRVARSQTAPSQGMCDTAVHILQDFVRAGDTRLGFPDTTGLAEAAIDTSEGLRLGYEDSALVARYNSMNANFPIRHAHRIMYPVYAQGTLHSAVMFDSGAGGWYPVRFADGLEIRRYCQFVKRDPRAAAGRRLVISDMLHSDYLVATGADGRRTVVLPTPLAHRMKKHLPPTSPDSTIVAEEHFFRARALMRGRK